MSQIEQQIAKDFVLAQKSRDAITVSALRMVRGALKNAQIDKRSELNDDEAIKVLRSQLKIRREAEEQFTKAGRTEQAEKEKSEAAVITKYLPAQMDPAALEKIVDETIAALGATSPADMGKVIGAVMAKVGGQADGSAVSAIAKQKLSK